MEPTTTPTTTGLGPALAVMRVVRRLLLTRARIGITAVLATLLGLAALAINVSGAPGREVRELMNAGVLLLAVPLITLVFSVASLGEPKDDGTLVYLWLKPLPRWQLALAACVATWQVTVPISFAVGAVVAVLGGRSDLLVPIGIAGSLASLAYGTAFVAFGLRTTRSLLAGLLYILLWEGFFASLSGGIATWTVRRWSTGLFANLVNVESSMAEVGTLSAVAVLLATTGAGLALTTRFLQTRDVP